MSSTFTIPIVKTQNPGNKPQSDLSFGKYFSDHMFIAKFNSDKGWHDAQVLPRTALALDPAASVLHYGQALFEGMKAFKQQDGKVALFRPEYNWRRMAEGAERLCMQAPPKELFLEGLKALVKTDADWIPTLENSSLYIRPTLIGTEGFLGVRPSKEYLFFIILSPVGSYYSEGQTNIKIWVEDEYLRAAPGGLGNTKAAANYAGSLKAAQEAKKQGYSQVLWLDVNKKYVEEVGTMNVFFVFDDEIVTPQLDGTILGGGVRDSVIHLLKSKNRKIVERKIEIAEVLEKFKNGQLKEIFGTGTAAIISSVGELKSRHWEIKLEAAGMGPVASEIYKELTDIQYGIAHDPFSWIVHI